MMNKKLLKQISDPNGSNIDIELMNNPIYLTGLKKNNSQTHLGPIHNLSKSISVREVPKKSNHTSVQKSFSRVQASGRPLVVFANSSVDKLRNLNEMKLRIRQERNTMKVEQGTKKNLSNQCRDNFIQFLLVQKAGQVISELINSLKPGDYQFYEKLKKTYQKQLFSQVKASPLKMNKKTIAYLNRREEKPETLDEQVKQIFSKKKHGNRRNDTPLDAFIQNMQDTIQLKLPPIMKNIPSNSKLQISI